jgi:glucose/arabinose dehydrogenase
MPPLSRSPTPFVLAPILVLAAGLLACGSDDGGGGTEPPPPAAVASVTVTAPTSSIPVGQTVQLTATALDANGNPVAGQSFQWSTGDAAVATVSSSGLVTGVAEGQTPIQATTAGVSGTVTISVTAGPGPGPVTLGLEQVVSGLRFPTYLTAPPGDTRLFVLEKAGLIKVIKNGALLPQPFLDLTSDVSSQAGEQGLLGLAFPPDYASTGRLYVHFNGRDGLNRVSRMLTTADPDRGDPLSETVVLAVSQPGVAHNGGQLVFGPDGFLYIGLGDGDDSDNGRGQSVEEPLASILRLDVFPTPYSVPADNPFVGVAGARPEIWSYGLRNPWSFSFDAATGDLYIADVGESDWEELNFSSAAEGAGKGLNYGWSIMEGQHCTRTQGCDQRGLVLPVLEYPHTEGCSIIGGHVYRGAAIPSLQGTYFYADYCAGWVRSLKMVGGVPTELTERPELEPGGQITSIGKDAAGELYIVTQQGAVHKIVAAP